MNDVLMVKGWEEWQSYRKDRGSPPWIKVHRKLLSNHKWSFLSDSEKGQLVSIWIVASDNDGEVSANPKVLRKICQLDEEPNLAKFKELGFLIGACGQYDVKMASTGCQYDAPEKKQRREETETETEAEKKQRREEASEPIKIIQAFDQARNEFFGEELKRPYPDATDKVFSERFLAAGADAATCLEFFRERFAAMKSSGKNPPSHLKYFEKAIPEHLQKLKQDRKKKPDDPVPRKSNRNEIADKQMEWMREQGML